MNILVDASVCPKLWETGSRTGKYVMEIFAENKVQIDVDVLSVPTSKLFIFFIFNTVIMIYFISRYFSIIFIWCLRNKIA